MVRELLGPRDLTYAEVAAAIGAAIGRPELPYVQLPDDELAASSPQQAGFSPDFAGLFVEFNRALSERRLRPLEAGPPQHPHDQFEAFARELAEAYAAAA